MSQTPSMQTLPIGEAAQALGVSRDNLYKHIERGRATINGVPFSAQQGPDKRWRVSIPLDLSPYLPEDEEADEPAHATSRDADAGDELDTLRREVDELRRELSVARAERDSYKGMIEATHQATLLTLERVVEKLSEAAPVTALPAPEPPKKKPWWKRG